MILISECGNVLNICWAKVCRIYAHTTKYKLVRGLPNMLWKGWWMYWLRRYLSSLTLLFFYFFSICGNGYPCFEISAVNADKPPLSVSQIKDRVKQFENVGMFVFQLYVLCGCKICSTLYLFWLWDWIYWSHKYIIKISKYPFPALVAFMKSSIMWKIEHHLPMAFSLNNQLLQQQNQPEAFFFVGQFGYCEWKWFC